MIVDGNLPILIERDVAETLTIDVYSDADAQQTASAGTITIYDGAEVVVDGANATVGGSTTASYSLAAATTTDRALSDKWLLRWPLTIGGVQREYVQRAYLVRNLWRPTIRDNDLTTAHTELSSVRPSSLTTYEKYRTRAAEKIQRDLLKRGRRPWLIFDSWTLTDAHLALTLHYVFLDFATSLGQGRYKELAEHYSEEYQREMGSVVFSYDSDEEGTISSTERDAAGGQIILTAGAPGLGVWR